MVDFVYIRRGNDETLCQQLGLDYYIKEIKKAQEEMMTTVPQLQKRKEIMT